MGGDEVQSSIIDLQFSISSLIGFGGASVAVAISPGASWMYVIANAASQGSSGGRAAIAGNATGILGHTVLAALGLSALIAYSDDVFSTVQLLGGLYLMFLAVRTVHAPSILRRTETDAEPVSPWIIYHQGIVMNLLNPKVAFLMVALLPQFITPADSPVYIQIAILGSLHPAIATIVLSILAALTLRAAPYLYESPRLERIFRYASGTVIFTLGARTALGI
ncbi:MAG: hypothetical protein CME19_09945 [Gemmatimonadetes bacterium]|nr:hypothetical protein [Gemmatimonadota bacterium]